MHERELFCGWVRAGSLGGEPVILNIKHNIITGRSRHTRHAYATVWSAYRRRFDSRIRVTRTAGDGRKEGAKYIQTYRHINIINSGPRGGYRPIGLIWGGGCGESVPLANQGHWRGVASHLVTSRYMLYSTPAPR